MQGKKDIFQDPQEPVEANMVIQALLVFFVKLVFCVFTSETSTSPLMLQISHGWLCHKKELHFCFGLFTTSDSKLHKIRHHPSNSDLDDNLLSLISFYPKINYSNYQLLSPLTKASFTAARWLMTILCPVPAWSCIKRNLRT